MGKALIEWWQSLEEHDRGGRAELRRASSVYDALMCPAFQRLQRRVAAINPEAFQQPYQLDRLAVVCALMAHVKTRGDLAMPKAMSHKKSADGRNPVSELRFKRLLDAPDDDALFTSLRRVLPLIDEQVDLLSLAASVLNWGQRIKREWAYAYDWPAKK
ncbi:MAG: type I-E CRISPR-associated protein Cse2/CasB [Aquabacterium sp.]